MVNASKHRNAPYKQYLRILFLPADKENEENEGTECASRTFQLCKKNSCSALQHQLHPQGIWCKIYMLTPPHLYNSVEISFNWGGSTQAAPYLGLLAGGWMLSALGGKPIHSVTQISKPVSYCQALMMLAGTLPTSA